MTAELDRIGQRKKEKEDAGAPMKLLLLPNPLKPDAQNFSAHLAEELKAVGQQPYFLEEKPEFQEDQKDPTKKIPDGFHPDIAVIFGGDGTFLHYFPLLVRLDIPVLGVKFGTVGHLTDGTPESALPFLLKAAREQDPNKRFCTMSRMTLEGEIREDGKESVTFCALNELTLYRASMTRALRMELSAGKSGNEISDISADYAGDGILVSTPTGSTAYNRSAGGPILMPDMECMLLTPICPRTFPNRSIVIHGGDTVAFQMNRRRPEDKGETGNAALTADGCRTYPIGEGSRILIRRGKKDLKTVLVR